VFDETYIYLYTPEGKLAGKYTANWSTNGSVAFIQGGQPNVYFAGKQIQEQGQWVMTDRLGSVRLNGSGARSSYLPYGAEVTPTTSDQRTKFATYYRDSAGLDYAGQRYYSNVTGRFLTPDPAIGSAGPNNPQSWNRYSYVVNDPANSLDPQGLCSVIVGGLTQVANPGDPSPQEEFANEVGGISAFPYAGGSFTGGVANVIKQGLLAPTGATLTALQAISLAATNPGPISIYAYSGGAGAFAAAWSYLTPAVQDRIQDITYIDPGSAQSLPGGNGANVTVYDDANSLLNLALQFLGGSVPLNSHFVDTGNCGHNANCVFTKYAASLSQTASYCPTGSGGVFGAPSCTVSQFGANPFGGYYWYSWEVPPTPWVTSAIHYNAP
jgi:RHS repeat-associated protein